MRIVLNGKEIDAEVIINTIEQVPETEPAYKPLEGWHIAYDAGHGGTDPGAVSGTIYEKDLNRKMADAIISRLRSLGAEVIDIRQNDEYVDLADRARKANDAAAHIFVSGHHNSAVPEARGIETYHYPGSYYGSLLADAIHQHVAPASGLANRGVKQANFQVLRETSMPAALIEFGFLSNPEELAIIMSDDFVQRVSQAVAEGITEFCSSFPELKA